MVEKCDRIRKRLVIAGQVQGVGFRPFIFRLAVELGLTGWVLNDASGVTLEVQGTEAQVEEFIARLSTDLPPLARISRYEESPADVTSGEQRFEIRPSSAGELTDAQVTVDTATCHDCLRELRSPSDPRHRYPFINCTNCGPRYSIVRRIPYDRPNTTMADFAMCPFCAGEYADPHSRRFHAQPIACPACGPNVWLVDTHGKQITCDDPIRTTAEMLRSGKIVAVKGLGGFHLAVRADDEHAVRRLRERKRRDAKPFAVMVADLPAARSLCEVTPPAEKLLTGPLRPIVLLRAKVGAPIARTVADGLDTLGIMLPYTPLHHLLFAEGIGPQVMTSGNYSDEPLVCENESAIAHLGRIADALLLHNRRIERRIDDSVVQVSAAGSQVFRRARSYAPTPFRVPVLTGERSETSPAVLAVGSELKNTVCLLQGGRAVLSEHIGDLKDGRVFRHFIDTINHLEELFEVTPELIAADLHPQYLSTDYAMKRYRGDLPGRPPLPIVRVQHHHAHAAACLVENDRTGPAIALICDGVGYGDDGAVWGCEVLWADLQGYERLGHLRYLPLIGGDAAAHETYRPAVAALHDTFGAKGRDFLKVLPLKAERKQIDAALEMLAMGVNCPQSSSLGRWFDAVAALCGIASANRYEGEAPMKLEAAIDERITDVYAFRIHAAGPFLLDLRPMVEGIVFDLEAGVSTATVAAKFHNTVARFLAAAGRRAREETGLNTVALSGGCFANRHLSTALAADLEADGFDVLTHRTVPCNDGGVALGQAAVALTKRRSSRRRSGLRMDEGKGN